MYCLRWIKIGLIALPIATIESPEASCANQMALIRLNIPQAYDLLQYCIAKSLAIARA